MRGSDFQALQRSHERERVGNLETMMAEVPAYSRARLCLGIVVTSQRKFSTSMMLRMIGPLAP